MFLKIAEKHLTKSVIETEIIMSRLSNSSLKIAKYFIKTDKNGACCNENNMGSEVEVTFCSKYKGKKRVLDGVLL